MAQMIPDRMPTNHSTGERRLFGILQGLPDDWLVYFEPIIGERYPDFLVIAPDLGVIVIEVKGWYPNEILGGDLHTVRVRNRGVEKDEAHPIRQARGYQHRLQDECRRHEVVRSLLLNSGGKHEGKFIFPFCHFAILSNITTEQLLNHRLGDLTTIFPPNRVLARDGFVRWEGLPAEEIREAIKAFFDPFWEFPRLSDRQVESLRVVIHPEIALESRSAITGPAMLDLRQERHARDIGNGHRIVYG